MLRHRLILGTLMTVAFAGIVLLDAWLDGSFTASPVDDKPIQATIFILLVELLMLAAHFEFSNLAAAKGITILLPVSMPGSMLVAAAWYWPQLFNVSPAALLLFLLALSLLGLFVYQRIACGTSGVIANCGAASFAILYLGLLSAFVPALRIDFGPWALLMFIFVVKSADIGAYTVGRLFGKHKFSPVVSPKKTWEGMAGAIMLAAVVAVVFAVCSGIMSWSLAVLFGLCFAFIGQLGDLAESMIKRDVERKDSSDKLPGFGGILDVVDSVLVAAPFAYLFFVLFA